jgi:hypothetical protein
MHLKLFRGAKIVICQMMERLVKDAEGIHHSLISHSLLSCLLPGVTKENNKNVSQDSLSQGRHMNLGPPKCETGVLPTQL